MTNKKTKHQKYPSLDFVDRDILDLWEKVQGEDPDWWDTKEILLVQIIRILREKAPQ
jgi:hypothetical protein